MHTLVFACLACNILLVSCCAEESAIRSMLSKISGLIGGCSLCFLTLLLMPAQAQISTEHQLGVLGTSDEQLERGNYFDIYEIEGLTGQRVSISLDSSDFNAFLALIDSDGNLVASNDDAATENINSYIATTLPQSGSYTVVATSQNLAEGDYRLVLRKFRPPTTTVANGQNRSSSGFTEVSVSSPMWDLLALGLGAMLFGGGSDSYSGSEEPRFVPCYPDLNGRPTTHCQVN